VSQKIPRGFLAFIPKRLGIFSPNFTYSICVSMYAGLQIFIQLSLSLTKLWHIKCDHPVHTICSKFPPLAERMLAFSDIFLKQLEILGPNFTHHLWSYAMFSKLQNSIQYLKLWRSYAISSATTQHAFQLMVDILSMTVVALNMA